MSRVIHPTWIAGILLIGIVVILAAVFVNRADAAGATLTHLYNLDGNLNDSLGGPSLVPDGGAVDLSRYTFGPNQGLRLNGGLADTSNYSVAFLMELDSMSPFWKKIVDFRSRSSDHGLYVRGDRLDLFPDRSGGPTALVANTDFLVVLTRESSTGETKGYINGIRQWTFTGTVGAVIEPPTNELTFFEDDFPTGTREAQAGSVDCIAVYDGALSEAEVAALAAGDGCGASDDTPPEVAVPGDFSVEATSPDGAVVNFFAIAEDDVDGPVDVSCSPASGSTFPLGETEVVCTAEDDAGNEGSASFTITVEDATPPDVTAPEPLTVQCSTVGGTPTSDQEIQDWLASASASDNVDGTVSVSNDLTPGLCAVGTAKTVNFSATDAANNTGTASSSITVIDTVGPVATAWFVPIDVEEDEGTFQLMWTCSDACDDTPTVTSATLNGISVSQGQIVELELDDEMEWEWEDGILEIEGTSFVLDVTCTDDSGNDTSTVASPVFVSDDEESEDEDDEEDDEEDDDD